MRTLRKVFTALEASALTMEPGFFNLFMTMVAVRAQAGDATVRDGWRVIEWLTNYNCSTPGGMDWGLDLPTRTTGFEAANFEWRVNYTRQEERFRDFHPYTDLCGNTLRSVYESLLSVIAGAARAGRCRTPLAQARQVLQIMDREGMRADLGTYTQMLLVLAAAAPHGRAKMSDVEEVVLQMQALNLEMDCVSYGAWGQCVAGLVGVQDGVTWRHGEAIIEIELRRGIRPDFHQFVVLMEAVATQARAGIPSPVSLGCYVYDPLADARAVLVLMGKVENNDNNIFLLL